MLPAIQAKIPQVDAIKVLALIQGSVIAAIVIIVKPGTEKGAVKATDVSSEFANVLDNLNIPGLTPKPNQNIAVVVVEGNYFILYNNTLVLRISHKF